MSSFSGIGVGFCGLVDSRIARIVGTNKKFDDGPSLDLPHWAREALGLRLEIENDARMALLGEQFAGAARGFDDVVMFTLGTGIGGAAMVEGRLLRGKHAQAGCLAGHFAVRVDGRACTCGAAGCAESEASGWSLPLVCHEWPGLETSRLDREPVNFKLLLTCAHEGDPVARQVLAHCIRVWATNTVTAVHAYDPELVLFGGGVMAAAEEILPEIESYVHRHAWTPWGKVQIRAAQLGSEAGLLGAVPLLAERN
jgi:glucokinase